MAGALAIAALILSYAPPHTIGPPWMLALLGALAMLWVLWQPSTTVRDDVLPALAVVLAAFGLGMVARLAPALAQRQQLWILVSLALAIGLGPLFSHYRRFAAYKYLWVVASLALFAMLLLFGQEVNGARLWIRLGPIQYEPIELIKLFIVLFLAAYLAETADVIGNARPWSLRANVKYLGPLFVGWGASMAILVVQRDLGMATLLLATFATLLFVATRRVDIVLFGTVLFALGAFWAVHPIRTRAPASRSGETRSPIRSAPDINRRRPTTRWPPAAFSAAGTGSVIPNSSGRWKPITSMPRSPRSLD